MAPSAASHRPMKHIDRKDLYTNLEARVQYLHTFLDFGSNDIEALTTGSKYIKQLVPAVVNIVYHKLLQYDITARAFETRSTSYDGPVDPALDDNSPQILHRKMFLRAYLTKLCSDPSTMEFWYYLDKVGMMHVGRGRQHPLHVEYVHVGACLAFIQDTLTEALLAHPRIRMDRKIALVKALNKVIWIQNDLFAKWYVRDGDEFAAAADSDAPSKTVVAADDREGYLAGRRVLDDIDEEDDGRRHEAARSCPFSGIPIRTAGKKDEGGAGAGSPTEARAVEHVEDPAATTTTTTTTPPKA